MIVVDGEAFRRGLMELAGDFDRAIAHALEDTVAAAEQHAAASSLFDDHTQRLLGSTEGYVDMGRHRARLRNAAPYAHFIEEGTRPHPISARRSGTLRFEVGGQVVYRRRVMHPGTKPRPFMRQAGEAGTNVLTQQLDVRLTEAILGP